MIAMNWTVETVSAVEAEIEALPVVLRARLIRLLEVVEIVVLEVLRAPHVRHLDGKLWELRVRAEGGIARRIYVTAAGRRAVVLHVFAKKSRRTPRRALATARERMRQVTP
ncbi:MAG: type II toxin-antitoxin system RelE/ParE family toxin [Immundisolibacterales bacterium]|nr:type II toxin-antitoxin system RelE/ParE family toxin [Immundisolibacterales bacterium]